MGCSIEAVCEPFANLAYAEAVAEERRGSNRFVWREGDVEIVEQGEPPRQGRRRPPGAGDMERSPLLISPVPRLALTQKEACASLGCSEEFFVEHIRPHMRVIRRGRKRLFPVDELRRVVDELAEPL